MTIKPLLLLLGLGLVTTPMWADDLNENFEAASNDYWVWGKGRNSSGAAEISTEKAHSGASSTKISFNFTDDGWIEFFTGKGAAIQGDTAYVSLWATGLKSDDFVAAALRFTDKNGETFQYDFPQLVEAASSPNWKEARTKIDLTQPKINWGANADGILDKPIRFSGFGLTRKRGTLGAFFIDDLNVSEAEIPAGATPAGATPVAPLTIKDGSISGGGGALKFTSGGATIPAPDAAAFNQMMRSGQAIEVTSGGAKWRIEPLSGWRNALPMGAQGAADSDSSGQLEKFATSARATLSYTATEGKNKYVQFPVEVALPSDAESVGAIFKTEGPTPLVLAIRTRDERNELMGFVLGTNAHPTTRSLQTPNYRWGAPDSKTTTAPPRGQLKTFGIILEATAPHFAGDTEAQIESIYVVRRIG